MLYIAVFVRLSPLSFWLESVGNTIKSRDTAGDTVDGVQFVAPPLTFTGPGRVQQWSVYAGKDGLLRMQVHFPHIYCTVCTMPRPPPARFPQLSAVITAHEDTARAPMTTRIPPCTYVPGMAAREGYTEDLQADLRERDQGDEEQEERNTDTNIGAVQVPRRRRDRFVPLPRKPLPCLCAEFGAWQSKLVWSGASLVRCTECCIWLVVLCKWDDRVVSQGAGVHNV